MDILLLDLDSPADGAVASALRTLASSGRLSTAGSVGEARERLNREGADLLVLHGADGDKLLGAFSFLAANCRTLPPPLVISACSSVAAVVALHKTGVEGYLVKDAAGRWLGELTDEATAMLQRAHARRMRDRLDRDLRDSERRLAQIVDGSPVAMFVVDREHCVTHWNIACEALTGCAASDMIGTSDQWRAFYASERPCMADLVLDGAIEERIARYYGDKKYRHSRILAGTYEAEDFFPAFGNGGRWLYFTAAPLVDSHGEIVGALETLQDITEQKRAEFALHEKESLLRQIIEHSSVATFVIDREHRVTHWNHACELLLEKPASEALGSQRLADNVYAEPRPVLADLVVDDADDEMYARYYGGRYRRSPTISGVVEVDDYIPTLGEGGRWLHFAAAPLRDGAGVTLGAIETLIDITERKEAESRIRESEQRLSRIIDGIAVATFVIDTQHRITHWNRACAALTGLTADEMLGSAAQWRAFYREERPCMADLVVEGAIEERVAEFYGSKRYHRSLIVEGGFEAIDFFPGFGSSGRWLYFTAAPLRDGDGNIVGAIETLQDITEQKRVEDSLRQSEERYRQLSITDGMTGLYNARHFAQRLATEMERCSRYRHPLALLVLDVDNFKAFNDTWGHVQGDAVLQTLAGCITACLRRTDQAFRYGGEEFVVLLPETDLDDAEAAAERVRAMFAACDFKPASGPAIRCTASIGVTIQVPGESPRDFVARADKGTYEAKRLGKNRVVRVAPPQMDSEVRA